VKGYWKTLAFCAFWPLVVALGALFVAARARLLVRAGTGLLLVAWVARIGVYIALGGGPFTHSQRVETIAIFGGLPGLLGVLALG
jgi:hypothetical protein